MKLTVHERIFAKKLKQWKPAEDATIGEWQRWDGIIQAVADNLFKGRERLAHHFIRAAGGTRRAR